MNKEIIYLFDRDLERLLSNMEEIPAEQFWKPLPGVSNSCGVLVQHITGNLKHFIGAVLGNSGYVRDRKAEFTPKEISKKNLILEVRKLKDVIRGALLELREEDWEEEYPADIPYEANTRGFVIHLYGHLNYHLGQLNYLRRILEEKPEN